mmetsp:Transcript_28409/g.45621  ORF Transcript_28409/g.45621 Transcript_28409/m.45621 type:complete len:462 (+) Transcript_28409:1-1386(+)
MVILMDTLNFGIVFPLLPSIAETFGADATQVGSLATAYSVAQVLFTPILGKASDRFGRRPVLLIAVFGTMLSAAVTGLAWNFYILLLARAVNGASGGTAGIANAYVADVTTPEEKAVYISYLSAANSIGIILGPALGGVLSHLGFSVACYASTALSAVNLIAALAFLTESRVPLARGAAVALNPNGAMQTGGEENSGRPLISHSAPSIPWSAGLLYGAGFLFMLGFAAFESVTGYFLMDVYFHGNATKSGQFYGMIFVIAGFTMFLVAVFVYKPLLKVAGERGIVCIGLFFRTAGFLGMAHSPTPLLFGIYTSIQVGGSNLIMPTTSAMLTTLCSKEIYGRALGYQQAFQAVARVFAPIIFGYMYDNVDHYISFYVCAISGVFAAGLILAVPKAGYSATTTFEDVVANVETLQRQQSMPPSLDNTPLHGQLVRQVSGGFEAGSARTPTRFSRQGSETLCTA